MKNKLKIWTRPTITSIVLIKKTMGTGQNKKTDAKKNSS